MCGILLGRTRLVGTYAVWGVITAMKRDAMYRAYCATCREVVRWQEPSCRRVDKILCPGCGKLLDPVHGSPIELKGELVAEARTFVEPKKRK